MHSISDCPSENTFLSPLKGERLGEGVLMAIFSDCQKYVALDASL